MATTTTNFGWDIPQSTDLVKDGATAIAALGQDIDTAFIAIKGGTTGQVLAKASGTDLDFSWVAQDDSNAIQNAIVDAKGDLISATANDTPARLAVGTNNQVLTVDSTTATGLKWATPAAGGGITLITSTAMSASASFTFASIPSTYKHLIIIVKDYFQSGSSGAKLLWELNSDTTAGNYDFALNQARGGGNTAYSANNNQLQDFSTQNTDGNNFCYIYIPDYTNTVAYKQAQIYENFLSDNGLQALGYGIANWRQNAAITQIVIKSSSANNFSAGTIQLYGVN